jgi:purine nucleosidase
VATPLILDTDIGTDVDDALALAFALRHPDIDLAAVTTVSGDVTRRAHIASKLLRLAGRDDIEVAAGLGEPPGGRGASMGHEGEGLLETGEEPPISDRGAVELLVELAATGPRYELATVGMQTNVAAAVERDQGFAGRVARMAVMGGVFKPIVSDDVAIPPSEDHNLVVDGSAAVRALNSGIPLLYVPLDVTVETFLARSHVEALRSGDELCRALAALVDVWAPILHRFTRGRMPADHVAVMHDPLTVAALVDRSVVTTEVMPVTVALHGGAVRTFVDPVEGRPAEVVTSVEARAFADFWLETVRV